LILSWDKFVIKKKGYYTTKIAVFEGHIRLNKLYVSEIAVEENE